MVKGLLGRWHGMNQAKILGEKRVPYFPRPRIEDMACNAKLHPNGADLFPTMLLRIAEDVLRHGVRQWVVGLMVDRNVHHRDPLSSYLVEAPAAWRRSTPQACAKSRCAWQGAAVL